MNWRFWEWGDGLERKRAKCVKCGKDSGWYEDVPVEDRVGYIPGLGQYCPPCFVVYLKSGGGRQGSLAKLR